MNNLSVGMKCLIIGTKSEETRENIGKIVTLLEYLGSGEGLKNHCKGITYLNNSNQSVWVVEGSNLLALHISNKVSVMDWVSIASKYLMPIDGYKIEEKEKQEEFV